MDIRLTQYEAGGGFYPIEGSTSLLADDAEFSAARPGIVASRTKRLFDVTGALFLFLLFWPLILIAILAIRLDSNGSAIYRQRRLGLRGRPFTMYKFRTMYDGAERLTPWLRSFDETDGPTFKMTDDPRITSVGRWLRRFSIDELPQLFNVLRGEMSLVGPRPPLPSEAARYEAWQRRRLMVKPGLTCIWQVSGRSEIPFERWMRMDLAYIDNWSLWLDIRLCLRTVGAVLGGRGAR